MLTGSLQVVRLTMSQIKGNSSLTDPSMLLLIPSQFWKDRYTFALPVFTGGSHGGDYTNVIQIVIPTSQVSTFNNGCWKFKAALFIT